MSTTPPTTTSEMEDIKKSLLRYLQDDRERLNVVVNRAEDQASELRLGADDHDEHVVQLLTLSDTKLYHVAQKTARQKQLLKVGTQLPPYQSKRDPCALEVHSLLGSEEHKKRLQTKHNTIIRAVCQVAKELETTCDSPYNFLKHSEEVYKASLNIWEKTSTWSVNMGKILQFMHMIGEPTEDLYAMFKEGQLYAEDHAEIAAPRHRTLSPEESAQMRELNRDEFFPQAMQMLDDPEIASYDAPGLPGKIHRMKCVHDAIETLYLYGSTEKHELLRNDLVDIVFKTPTTDPKENNFVTVKDGKVTLTMNYLHKVKPGGVRATRQKMKEALVLDVTGDNPDLAALWKKYELICKEIHGTNPAYALFEYSKEATWGKKLNSNALSSRNKRVYKGTRVAPAARGLIDADLAERASGTTRARHAACGKDRAGNPTHEEHNAQCEKRGHAGDKQSVARKVYAQDLKSDADGSVKSPINLASDDGEPDLGTRVSLTRLNSPRGAKLNGTLGIVVDFDEEKERFRVNLDTGHSGLFKRENLMMTDAVPTFGDLQKVAVGGTLGGDV
jgi:hypothetical protein